MRQGVAGAVRQGAAVRVRQGGAGAVRVRYGTAKPMLWYGTVRLNKGLVVLY